MADIIKDINNLNLKVVLHSSKNINLKNTDIYIVDSFGETKKFHKISSTVFLGGSIIKRGGQTHWRLQGLALEYCMVLMTTLKIFINS